MRNGVHAWRWFESDMVAAMVVALFGGWTLMTRGPAAHWRAVGAFITLTAEAWVIHVSLRELTKPYSLRELMEPDRAKRNKRAVAFLIIVFCWFWIKDLFTLLRALKEYCSIG